MSKKPRPPKSTRTPAVIKVAVIGAVGAVLAAMFKQDWSAHRDVEAAPSRTRVESRPTSINVSGSSNTAISTGDGSPITQYIPSKEETDRKIAAANAESDRLLGKAMDLLIEKQQDDPTHVSGTSPLTKRVDTINAAEGYYEDALELWPENPKASVVEVTILRANAIGVLQGSDSNAIATFVAMVRGAAERMTLVISRAAANGEDHWEQKAKLGELLGEVAFYDGNHKQEWLAQGIEALEQSIAKSNESGRGSGPTHFNLSRLLGGVRQTARAVEHAERAVRYNSFNEEFAIGLAVAYAEDGKPDKSQAQLKRIVDNQLLAGIPETLANSIEAVNCLTRREYKDALQRIERGVKHITTEAESDSIRARAHLGLGNLEKASQFNERALAFDAKDPLYIATKRQIEDAKVKAAEAGRTPSTASARPR